MIKKLNLIIVVIFLVVSNQVINAQRSIGPPSLESGAQACGNNIDNQFTVIAELFPGNALPTNNEFILELSDASGSFNGGGTELARVLGPNNGTSATQDIIFENFPIPEDANSDDYRLRITSSEVDNLVSQLSEPVAFHYFERLRFRLNGNEDIIFCDVTSFSRDITVRLFDQNNNPVDANNFEWEWYRNNVLIPGQSTPTITITEVGTYQAIVPLGQCQVTFQALGTGQSNTVDAILTDVDDVTITGNNPTLEYCPQDIKQLTSSVTDPSFPYQWFKDGVALDGEISSSILLPDNSFAGEYTLEIKFSDDCTIVTNPVTVTNISSTFTVPLPDSLILLPGQTLSLTAETNAPLGSIFRFIVESSVLQQGPLTSQEITFDAPFVGTYRIEIEPDDDCESLIFTETVVSAAERFELTIGPDGLTDCDQDSVTIELLELLGVTSTGSRVALTDEQFAFFDFEWFKDGVSTGDTSLSLDIDRSDVGGSFELRAIFRPGGLPDTISNNLPIDFLSNNITLDINPPILEEGGQVTLTAPQSTAFTYEWFQIVFGSEVLISGETTNTLVVSEEGEYFVRISSLLCTTDTLIAQVGGIGGVSELIPNVITPGGSTLNDLWVLPSLYRENDVEVTIYTENGQIEFQKSGGYNADWPTDSVSQATKPIYYYVIVKNNAVVKKGTITVMR